MAIPADMLEEVGIGPCSTVQMHVSRGRIIIQAVDSLNDQNILRPKLQEIALIFVLALDKVVNRQFHAFSRQKFFHIFIKLFHIDAV